MPYELVVTRQLGDKPAGTRITDEDEIKRILAPGHSHNVVRVWVDPPVPEPEPAIEPVVKTAPLKD